MSDNNIMINIELMKESDAGGVAQTFHGKPTWVNQRALGDPGCSVIFSHRKHKCLVKLMTMTPSE